VVARTGAADPSPLGEPLLTADVVAEYFACDKATVYRLAAVAALPSIDIAPRVLRFRPADVRAFMERRTRRRATSTDRVKRLLGPSRAS
jgi:predicted DNA-binding transcriptional regulator AlpA